MARKFKRESTFKFSKFSRKQSKVLNWWRDGSPYRYYDILIADGAIRSGKTISMICSFLQFTQSNFDGQNFIIAGKTIGTLKRNVIQPMQQIMEAWGWNYIFNRSDNYIVIGSNTYFLFGANTEASQDSLQGLTAAGAFADEVALMPQSFVDQMIGRCSVKGSKMFMNCNPKSPFHYFKTEYIDKAKEKKILYIHFSLDDNLSLAEEIKDRYRRMFTGVFFKRYILGLWVQAEGIIYDMFTDDHIVNVEDRKYSEYYIASDYGIQNPNVYLLLGKCKNKWYVVDEYYWNAREVGKQKTDEEYYNDLVDFVGNRNIKAIIIDPSASSMIALIRKRNKFKVIKANNDVLKGIANVSTRLKNKEILVNNCCTNLIKEFYSYSWDSKALERGEDIPVKVDDHCMDALRYFINTILIRSTEPYSEDLYRKGKAVNKNINDLYSRRGKGGIF